MTPDALRLHLKKFLRVNTEDSKTLAFRYDDPRVLNVFLPTCAADEVRDFLEPVGRLIAEAAGDAVARMFDMAGDALRVTACSRTQEDAEQ